MPALHLIDLSFAYSSAVSVIDDLTAHIGPGWTGVVGANGAGKTTLLRLAAGELTPTSGRVVTDPGDALVTAVEQTIDRPRPGVEALADSDDPDARRWIGRLDLDPGQLDRWATLSPGERKRWQVAASLATRPDILLLDEPTNHIDAEARALVVAALAQFTGVGLIVSHDRALLDELTTRTLRIDRTTSSLWNGNYTTARAAWEAHDTETLQRHDAIRRRERLTARRLADERRAADQRAASRRRDVRRAGVADRDARSMEAKARHAGGASSGAQRMSNLRAELDRTRAELGGFSPHKEVGGSIFVDYEPSPKRVLLRHRGDLMAGRTMLARNLDVTIEREDRIRLTGPNGAGKSTLLRALLASSPSIRPHLLYLPQELDRTQRRALLAEVGRLEPAERGRVLSIVALLGVDPDHLLASDDPSPGESRKLGLALGLGTYRWGLLLDEPTNHFDLPAVERLETALGSYPGALVLVTHDEQFAFETTSHRWHLDNGTLTR
jgi:ATPase subunit of ABC transporter with duplicated ATPase domains